MVEIDVMTIKEKLNKLRELMIAKKIDIIYVPTDDYHLSEYVGSFFKEREYISGFTGSYGIAIITLNEAHLWTDGRYFLQADIQLKDSTFIVEKMGEKDVISPLEFLKKHLPGKTLGVDFKTISAAFGIELQKINAKMVDIDLIGEIWNDRPKLSCSKAKELSLKYVGVSRKNKISHLQAQIKLANIDALLISSLDDIMYVFNLRGDDVIFNPVLLSYALIYKDQAYLFIQEQALTKKIISSLTKDGIIVKPYFDIYHELININHFSLGMDINKNNYALFVAINDSNRIKPINIQNFIKKHIKNKTEIRNIKKAHLKDGIAMCKFLYWLEHTKEEIDEISVSEKLLSFRMEQPNFISPSFDTICGFKENGAIVHYSATKETSKRIVGNSFLLIDSGGQYLEGTTDITRTIVRGKVTDRMKRDFTLVLKGHINLSRAVFLEGTQGCNLDILAREPLWNLGLNYNHGTGHGVGYFLNVHEGPINIHYRRINNCVFREGMITSNEPGIYLENQYGIRHENLILCVKSLKNQYGQFYKFKNLTLVPFDLRGIKKNLLTEDEKTALNEYHSLVYSKISPFLDYQERQWLKKMTRKI